MQALIEWQEKGQVRRARWRSEAGLPPPADPVIGEGPVAPETLWQQLQAGQSVLWRGDWPTARRLMQALTRLADRSGAPVAAGGTPAEVFARHRERQGWRANCLARLLVPLGPDYRLALPRAQEVRQACREAWGKPDGSNSVLALRELLAVISAHEWRKTGVSVAALGGRIHPHYGVFSPLRGEYLDLVAQAPLPAACGLPAEGAQAFDIGTGSGVLAALLARRGLSVLATDLAPRALACAAENIERLGLTDRVRLVEADLFPPGRAPLVVCNPPWLPAQPTSPVEAAVYDPGSRMLRGFLDGLAAHLTPGGEGWLILSDLAEHLALRSRAELLRWIDDAGLCVLARMDTRPTHAKAQDRSDPLHAARSAEITSLWRLGVR